MKKLAPHVQLIKTDVFDENLLDFLENIDEFSSIFKPQYECTGIKQNCIVYDSRKNKKDRTKGLF